MSVLTANWHGEHLIRSPEKPKKPEAVSKDRSPENIAAIREMAAKGTVKREMARRLKITESMVFKICREQNISTKDGRLLRTKSGAKYG